MVRRTDCPVPKNAMDGSPLLLVLRFAGPSTWNAFTSDNTTPHCRIAIVSVEGSLALKVDSDDLSSLLLLGQTWNLRDAMREALAAQFGSVLVHFQRHQV